MLNNYLKTLFIDNFEHTPTEGQQKLLSKLADFVVNENQNYIFLLKGYAGTGKTSIISAFVKTLSQQKIKSVLMAPTGRAAKVFSNYAKKSAFTIHKKIYRQKTSKDGLGIFSLDVNLHTDTVFIVDEASMISNQSYELSSFGSGRLLDDLIEYVYNQKRCKLVILGDEAQLPPVGSNLSPALDKKELESFGKQVIEIYLTEVVRQSLESGILVNATKIRNLIPQFVDKTLYPKLMTQGFDDFVKITGNELIESITDSYDKYGMEQTLIVTRSNKRANQFNQGIRKSILWKEEEISIGDYIMVVKNNYYWAENEKEMDFIANGDIAEITAIKGYKDLYGFRFADVTLRFIDYENIELDVKILLDALDINSASLDYESSKKLYYNIAEDYQEIRSKKALYKKIRENEYFNALQIKFAYAVTCHKSQGGQWDIVYLDQGYLNEDMMNVEYLRWLYTGFTRAVKKLYLVNFNDDFFE